MLVDLQPGIKELRRDREKFQWASLLQKVTPLSEVFSDDNIYVGALIGHLPQKDIENPGNFRDENSDLFDEFVSNLLLDHDEAIKLKSVLHSLTFPQQGGEFVHDIHGITRIQNVKYWIATNQLVLLDGFEADSDLVKVVEKLFS